MGRVYIYLMADNLPVCWWKGRVSDFLDPNPQIKTIKMRIDKALAYIKSESEAGSIKLKL